MEVQRHPGEGRMIMWIGEGFLFALAEPFDENPATVGNGSMCGFQLNNAEEISAKHALVIKLGGVDEGGLAGRSDRFPPMFEI
jgi:hypothetical protein